MNTERKLEIMFEIQRRLNLWMANDTFENMTCGYSKLRFDMAIGLLGYAFEDKPEWMNKKDFKKFVTVKEYNSLEIQNLLSYIFRLCMSNEKDFLKNKTQ